MQASEQTANELGRLLAGAQGYTVYTHDGVLLGALERVRYETQVSRPDEIVVRGRGLFRRRRPPFHSNRSTPLARTKAKSCCAPTPHVPRACAPRVRTVSVVTRCNSTAYCQGRSTAAKEELTWPSDTNCATRTAPTKARS